MAITIRHLDGPLAGREQSFGNDFASILIGRSSECQVQYPEEYIAIDGEHLRLNREADGSYTIELCVSADVELDGKPAETGMKVTSGSVIRLGHGGPALMVAVDVRFGRPSLREREMAEIAWRMEKVELPDDLVISSSQGAEEGLVELFMKRKAHPPAVTAGVPGDARAVPEFEVVGSSIPRGDYALQAERALRRSTGVLWWAAIALGAAVAGYLLYRREAALGAVLGKLLYAAAPAPPATKEIGADLVDMSVFGPTAIEAGGEGLIQVFLHTLSQREIAKALAQETDPDTARRGVQTLAAEIARGQRVEIILEGRGLSVGGEMQTVAWRGEPCACQFTVSAPMEASGRTFHPRVLVLVDSVPVGSLTFTLKITAETVRETEPELRGDRARRYHYAFLSYASPDRAEVLKRAQGLKAGGTSFFNDLLSLDPGERWQNRLHQEIDRCDVFYLFWSSQAKESEWVMKETEYALARRMASANGDPDIVPVIIEGPPPPSPPESLKDIHFNDSLLYVLAGVGGGRSVSGN